MRKIQFRAGHYYHIYNRGVNRQKIFLTPDHWGFFIHRLRTYFDAAIADIIAYCLMPNHYHLLVHLKSDNFGKKVMQPLSVSYTKAINKQQSRTGPLFEGPFQAILIEEDRYLKHLSRYIHLNPVSAGFVKQPADWTFSSYRDYIGLRSGTLPKSDIILAQFGSLALYIDYVMSADEPEEGLWDDCLFDEG